MKRIDREIIIRSIDYDGYDYDQLCSLVDRWKYILVSKGLQRGDKIAISIVLVNPNQIALTIAAGELGLQLFIIDWPIAYETLSKTKLGLFGPVDLSIECDHLASKPLHKLMIAKYSKQVIPESTIENSFNTCHEFWGQEDDPFLIASTSGTTKESTPIVFTQKQIYDLSKRNIKIFKFFKDTRVGHTKNMHHASSIITDLIPSLMASDFHRSCFFSMLDKQSLIRDVVPIIRKYKLERILMYNTYTLQAFLKALGKGNDWTILINMSGFTVPESFIKICKDYNIEFLSHYGSIDTAIPLLVNHVTEDTKHIPNSLGILPDDFNKVRKVEEGYLIKSPVWEDERLMQDKLEEKDGVWIHHGRIKEDVLFDKVSAQLKNIDFTIVVDNDKRYLALWDHVDCPEYLTLLFDQIKKLHKPMFMPETKVNMDQLRGFFQSCKIDNRELFNICIKHNPLVPGKISKEIQEYMHGLLNKGYSNYDIDRHHEFHDDHSKIFIVSHNKDVLLDFIENEKDFYNVYFQLKKENYNPEVLYNAI